MVELNEYGFYSLINKPGVNDLKEYYEKKYYQEDRATYQSLYNEIEHTHIYNKIEQKYYIIKDLISLNSNQSILDIGCGEGHTLNFFEKCNWDVLGLDYSNYGLLQHNPQLENKIIIGDIYKNIEILKQEQKKFDIIWLDNVLEHVLEPLDLLRSCFELADEKGILIVEVPNDYSRLQLTLLEEKEISNEFWLAIPDHISYFNKNGLINICNAANWKQKKIISDFPIDFNLFNPNANYVKDKTKGKGAHLQRIKLDNLFHEISVEKTNNLYEAMADLGMGRQLIGFFQKKLME